MTQVDIRAYLSKQLRCTLDEISQIIPSKSPYQEQLYDLMELYPFREAKGLRPALCIATCRALGGRAEAILPTAAVLELYHNAFLIHDDVEDDSEMRRGAPTLHRSHGVPIAVNVGDAMLALTLKPLLDNIQGLGLGRALKILDSIAEMARESAEGQAIELDWIRQQRWTLSDADYLRMVHKKTGWYSFLTPMTLGGIVAGQPPRVLFRLRWLGTLMGIAFQIQDDVLNLVGSEEQYGKEIAGDIYEGKRTLALLHLLRSSTPAARDDYIKILSKPRPSARTGRLVAALEELEQAGDLTPRGRARLLARLGAAEGPVKTPEEVQLILDRMHEAGSIDYARAVAMQHAQRAARSFVQLRPALKDSVDTRFLGGLIQYLNERDC